MKLRNNIITMVAIIMLLSLTVLLLMSVAGSLYAENNRKRELERSIRETVPVLYSHCGRDGFVEVISGFDFIADWRVIEGERVTAGAEGKTDKPVGKMYSSVSLNQSDDKFLFLIRGRNILQQSHITFLFTGVLFTLILAVTLYMLLSLLVIRPVELVIEASRDASAGIPPGRNPMPGRKDEAGIMVREFYSLLNEVFDYRQRLEEKVREASAEIKRTHQELVLSQRLSATGKLAAGIAHEINNPLGGMMNAVHKLKKESMSEKESEYFALLEECIQRIEKLVKELLSFVRKHEEFTSVSIEESVKFVSRMVSHSLKLKHIQLTDEIEPGLTIRGDTSQIQQLLLNLILNSIDSIEKNNGGIITIRASAGDDSVVLAVEDNGHGIADDDREHVFDLFFTTKESGKGTGLGLGIVHTIVGHHKGVIDIDSVEGEKTVITITFPLEPKE